jgi:hypothetical protein
VKPRPRGKPESPKQLQRFDWDFNAVEGWELTACCYYEYGRESPTIVAHYDQGAPLGFNLGLRASAAVKGKLVTLPNPLCWPWPGGSSVRFSETPWQNLPEPYRRSVSENYAVLSGLYQDAFCPADSPRMMPRIISRGGKRKGIDLQTGIERVAVEIHWASFTDKEIAKAALKWVRANRPPGIGNSSRRGRGKDNSWSAKLNDLAMMRLLHQATLSELPIKFPAAWKKYGPKKEQLTNFTTESHIRELYKMREAARANLHELFPFLPPQENPCSWVKHNNLKVGSK